MTATSLFDALSHARAGADPSVTDRDDSLVELARDLIASSLADLERLRDYEQRFVAGAGREEDHELEVRRSAWTMFAEWAKEAENILVRVRPLSGDAATFDLIDRLDIEVGRVQARLTVSPEQTVKAIMNARMGRVIPAKELRDELRARLRA